MAVARRMPLWALATGAVVVIAAVLVVLAALGGRTLPERTGPPIEELAVERTVLRPGSIELSVRNTGPDPVAVAQVFVNDAFVDVRGGERPLDRLATDRLVLDYPWQEGQPYLISMMTSTGLVIEHQIDAVVETPEPDGGFFALMALLGTYVGIVPVILGMLFLPVLRRADRRWTRALLALTVGLLAFLAVDATLEALEIGGASAGAFGGRELVFLGAGLAFVLLSAVDRHLRARRSATGERGADVGGARLAVMIAVGIGLHNLGEGLAIGSAYAIGELALGAFLIVGFAIHNTTEGLAIVAPLTRERPRIAQLVGLGVVAGAPAIAGAVLGAAIDNAELSALLLGVGVGAIAQVIVQLAPALRDGDGRILDPATAGGMAAGALALYATGLLVAV